MNERSGAWLRHQIEFVSGCRSFDDLGCKTFRFCVHRRVWSSVLKNGINWFDDEGYAAGDALHRQIDSSPLITRRTNRMIPCHPLPKKTHKKNIWSCLWCCVLLLYLYDDAFVAGEKLAQKIDKQASFSLHPTAKAAEPAPSEKLFNDEIAPRGEAAGVWIETRWCFFVWCNNCFWMELFIRSKRDFPLVLLFRENLTVFPFWLKLFAWTMSAHLIVENWLQMKGLRFDLNTGPAWYLDQNQQHLLFSCFNASYLKPS